MKEFAGQAWNKKKENAPNLVRYIRSFNERSSWFSSIILKASHLTERVNLISKFIEIGLECAKLKNYSSVFAINASLVSTPVQRLSETFNKLKSKEKKGLERLKELTDTSNNFQTLRKLFQEPPPLLPYIGVLLSDLTFTEDGNKQIVEGPNKAKFVNFNAKELSAKILKRILSNIHRRETFDRSENQTIEH